jgi:predicted nucleotidyltransferase
VIAGSHCYNLNVETSDFDYIAIYSATPKSQLGLPSFNSPSVITNSKTDSIDIAIYEVSKFLETLMTGSPVMIQCLFSNHFIFETKEFQELKKNSKLFITSQTIRGKKKRRNFNNAKLILDMYEVKLNKLVKTGLKKCITLLD